MKGEGELGRNLGATYYLSVNIIVPTFSQILREHINMRNLVSNLKTSVLVNWLDHNLQMANLK